MSLGFSDFYESAEPKFDKARHVKYWTRCIKTLLPHQYTGTDSNRMYLAFLMISALDLLGSLTTVCTAEERNDYINWIYHCQHPNGGFRMWPGTDFGERANSTNAKWDPGNVPATYFALASLLILGDDFKRVRRKETLRWLVHMQRADGSFGEILVDGRIEGGKDPRLGYCATGVRYILRGDSSNAAKGDDSIVDDVDVDGLVRCIRASESYDGGIGDEHLHEPHAGYAFCSIGALNFMDRLDPKTSASEQSKSGLSNPQEVVRWLVYRQTELSDPDAGLDSEFLGVSRDLQNGQSNLMQGGASSALYQSPSQTVINPALEVDEDCAGMNGRTNKVADTCYAWWAGASLHLLGKPDLYDRKAIRHYLLEKTQHSVLGGFGKFQGDLPDLYHSCLGLAALSLAGSEDVKEIDPGMCISKEASARLPALWRKWRRTQFEDRV